MLGRRLGVIYRRKSFLAVILASKLVCAAHVQKYAALLIFAFPKTSQLKMTYAAH